MQKILILLGVLLILLGVFFPLLQRLGIGHLPGDLIIKREGFTFYFPIVTCIVISLLLTLLFWIFNR